MCTRRRHNRLLALQLRHSELHVKEFEPWQTADLWLLLDLDRAAHPVGGRRIGEAAVSAAASIAVQTLNENRAVGMTVSPAVSTS